MNETRRSPAYWAAFNPVEVAQRASRNVVKAALIDAKHDLLVLQRQLDTLKGASGEAQEVATLNPADRLPPVACPLMIEVDGNLVKAERTEFVQHRGQDMVYRLADGSTLLGRFRWTYP